MRKVIGIGETILDIIFKNNQPIGAVPGGSMFNGLISLGRAGLNTTFISETGNDRVGKQIISFLEENHVDTSNISVYPESKSPVSLAFLNDNNDAEYIFYKDHPHDRLDFSFPEIQSDDIVMFGSFYAVNPVIRPQVFSFLEYAHNHGAILYYDVNFRSSHRNEVMKVTPNILENLELADIVRGSREDFEVMFNKQYPVAQTETVSTIGAGDNFNAGFIYGLIKYGITRDQIVSGMTEQQWDQVIAEAQQFSANVCQSINNSIDLTFANQKKLNI